MWASFKQRLHALKRETLALYLAARHPRTPWHAKLVIALVVAYAFSPIDLIPDFIPVLGVLDDLLLIPLGVVVAVKLIPADVMADCRERAAAMAEDEAPASKAAALVIVVLWVALAVGALLWARSAFARLP